MKISAIFTCAAAATAKVSRQARSQSLFDEILGEADTERSVVFGNTYVVHQVLQFYLINNGNDGATLADKLTSYGCWCQIRNHASSGIVPGHGQRVDALDELCHQWHQCRSCTTVDSVAGSCQPNSLTSNYQVGYNPITARIDCTHNNDDCQINTCKCDEQLAHGLANAVSDMSNGFVTNVDGSGFDHANQCRSSGGAAYTNNNNGPTTTQCCGVYPNRFAYSTQGGNTQCCGDRTFNRNRHECCADSFLTSIGECSNDPFDVDSGSGQSADWGTYFGN